MKKTDLAAKAEASFNSWPTDLGTFVNLPEVLGPAKESLISYVRSGCGFAGFIVRDCLLEEITRPSAKQDALYWGAAPLYDFTAFSKGMKIDTERLGAGMQACIKEAAERLIDMIGKRFERGRLGLLAAKIHPSITADCLYLNMTITAAGTLRTPVA